MNKDHFHLFLTAFLCLVLAVTVVIVGTNCGDDDDDDDSGPEGGSDDEIWTDPDSGYTWQKTSTCCYNFDDAMDYCNKLNLGGYVDWGMPNIDHLRSLVRGCSRTETGGPCPVSTSCADWQYDCVSSDCGGCGKNNGPDDGCYWPSELEGDCGVYGTLTWVSSDSDFAWFVDFHYGMVEYTPVTEKLKVRCVRYTD